MRYGPDVTTPRASGRTPKQRPRRPRLTAARQSDASESAPETATRPAPDPAAPSAETETAAADASPTSRSPGATGPRRTGGLRNTARTAKPHHSAAFSDTDPARSVSAAPSASPASRTAAAVTPVAAIASAAAGTARR